MCGAFHTSVRHMSDRFYAELNRHNYVTPTSYLALIWTFKSLLTGKRDEILNLKTRYEMGLGKLEFASNQVGAMQNELTELRPKLLETSDETERLMIKIEQDTIQVEAKKEIVACDEALANEAAAAAQVRNIPLKKCIFGSRYRLTLLEIYSSSYFYYRQSGMTAKMIWQKRFQPFNLQCVH